MKKFITAILVLSALFFSCNQAVKGEYATVVVDLDGSYSGARAIGPNGLPFLNDAHITIEADGSVSGRTVIEIEANAPKNAVLNLPVGDRVHLRVKAFNESGIWSGSTTFTVAEEGTNAVSVKLNKTITGARPLTFSKTRHTDPAGTSSYCILDVYSGDKKISTMTGEGVSTPALCRDAKGRIFVSYSYTSGVNSHIALDRYDSEGNNKTNKLYDDNSNASPLLASDLTTGKVYLLDNTTLYEVGERDHSSSHPWSSDTISPPSPPSPPPAGFSPYVNGLAAHGGQLFVLWQMWPETAAKLCIYDITTTHAFALSSSPTPNDITAPPSGSKYEYTDIFVKDGAVYLLRKDFADIPYNGAVYSKGALIRYDYNKSTKTISGGTEFGASDSGIQNNTILTPDTSFYGPIQFIGFDDDVLYIADDGVTFTYFNEVPRITANKNRIAAFNTTEKSLSFADTSATWRSEERRWKAPDSKIMLWKKAASGSFDYYAVNSADSPLGAPDLTSGSSKYADVFCFDQDGNLYIVKDVGSGSNDYKVQRFKIGEDGSYDLTPWGDTSVSLGTNTITAIAGDASGSIEVGGDRHNALYYIVSDPPNADRLGRVSWEIGNSLSAATSHGYNPISLTSSIPAITLDVTALAANKDGVFIATKETVGNTYTLKVYKLAHTATALPGTSLTVGTGTLRLSESGITYDEQITALQIQDGVLYGISTKTMQKADSGKTVAFTMSGKLLKLGSTDDSFTGTLTIDTALLYGQKDVDASSDGAFAPYRFIALKPKKLVIASDGGYGQNGTAENKNRVLTFTLDGSGNTGASASFDVVPAVNFSKEMRYDDAGGVGCGFMWN